MVSAETIRFNFLKGVPLFADLPEEDLVRLCGMVHEANLSKGGTLFEEGSPGDQMYVVQSGQVEIVKKPPAGAEILLAIRGSGAVIGEMSLLDAAPRIASVRALTDSRFIVINQDQLNDLLANSPSAARIILRTVTTRFRNTEAALRQSEKMAQIGVMAAGLAHELNNPSSAALRAVQQLRQTIVQMRQANIELVSLSLSRDRLDALIALEADFEARLSGLRELDAVERGDREELIEDWLAEVQVPSPWELAPLLVELEIGPPELDRIARQFPGPALPVVLRWLVTGRSVTTAAHVIDEGLQRVNTIVDALKLHAYLDQAPVQWVDIHDCLNNTLILLGNKLGEGITIQREYDPALPKIVAYGSELNQVWLHLLDNAIDVLHGRGAIVLRTQSEDRGVRVEIEDNGPGIPEEIQSKVFDPFFTTKAPGKGAGLGLHIVYTVIQKHLGAIEVASRPGKTVFRVRLPLDFEHTLSGTNLQAIAPDPGPGAENR